MKDLRTTYYHFKGIVCIYISVTKPYMMDNKPTTHSTVFKQTHEGGFGQEDDEVY